MSEESPLEELTNIDALVAKHAPPPFQEPQEPQEQPEGEPEKEEKPAEAAEDEKPAEEEPPAREVKESEWIAFRKGRKKLAEERKEVERLRAEYEQQRTETIEAEKRAIETGDIDEYFRSKFGFDFNEATRRYAQQQLGVSPEVRRELAEAKRLAEETKAKQEEIDKRRVEIESEQRAQAQIQAVSNAAKAGEFGEEAKILGEDPNFVRVLRNLAAEQIDPEEPPAEQRATLHNLAKSLVNHQKKQFQLLQRAFGDTLQADRNERGPGVEGQVDGDAPKQRRTTKTMTNRTSATPATPELDTTKMDFDEFMRRKGLQR